MITDESERVFVKAGAARDVGAIVNSVERWRDRAGDYMVDSGERISVSGGVSMGQVEDEGTITALLHIGDAGNECASRTAAEAADLGQRSAAGRVRADDLALNVSADVLAGVLGFSQGDNVCDKQQTQGEQ